MITNGFSYTYRYVYRGIDRMQKALKSKIQFLLTSSIFDQNPIQRQVALDLDETEAIPVNVGVPIFAFRCQHVTPEFFVGLHLRSPSRSSLAPWRCLLVLVVVAAAGVGFLQQQEGAGGAWSEPTERITVAGKLIAIDNKRELHTRVMPPYKALSLPLERR